MAHELEISRRTQRASFCYRKENGNPWHGLGQVIPQGAPFEEVIRLAGMDRAARREPVITLLGGLDCDADAIVYPDADGEDRVLRVVSKDYHIVQYPEVVRLAMAVVGSDDAAVLDTLGQIFEGRRMFGFIDFGDVETVLPNGAVDRAAKGLGFMSSHDASQSVTFWTTLIRAVCNNTVEAGIRSAKNIVRVRHSTKAEERMAEVPKLLGLAWGADAEFSRLAASLGRVPGGPSLLDRVIAEVWPKPEDEAPARSQKVWSNRRDRLHELYAAPSNAGGFGNSGWSVFNTVAEFLDHVQGSDDARARAAIDPSSSSAARKAQVADLLLAN